MIPQQEKIIAALRSLDPTNDGHWTPDGAPKLDVVRAAVGDIMLRREVVEAVGKGFSRTTVTTWEPVALNSLIVLAPGPSKTAKVKEPTVVISNAPSAKKTLDQMKAEAEVDKETVGEDPELTLIAVRDEMTSLREDIDTANKRLAELQIEESRLQSIIDDIRVIDTNPAAIRAYLDRQSEIAAGKAAMRKMIVESGLSLGDLTKMIAPSPLDSAMARKTGRGAKRPMGE